MSHAKHAESHVKHAEPEHPVHELIAARWSPYVFAERAVAPEDLRSLFEAARWAASSYNEQPWRFIVATRDDEETYQRILSCLVPGNQEWAARAPVIGITVISDSFTKNDKPNRVALHDLGLAMGNLSLEATHRGLAIHQMAGLDREKAKKEFELPDGFHAETAFAIGYPGEPSEEPELGPRDRKPRSRKALGELVFGGSWDEPAPFLN